ncbi:MAG: hypothetical protein QOF76_2542, partial [Solirubrobacteraceae bacterium]|nr:hypothetical protein [Solirubrobacteraceae bacterium]
GLAVKHSPCCYALQLPIEAARQLPRDTTGPFVVRTPAATVQPLIHARPRTGLEGKFSLQYAIATALLDDVPGFEAFSDAGVQRPEAQAIIERVSVALEPGGAGLLDGEVVVEAGGERAALQHPLGSPARPASTTDLETKRAMCGAPAETWASAQRLLCT